MPRITKAQMARSEAESRAWRDDFSDYIALALATPGGHLSIGRGGATLHFVSRDGCNSTLSGCSEDSIKSQAIAAGLCVIDTRAADFGAVAALAISGPMVAFGAQHFSGMFGRFSMFGHAPLSVVAAAYAWAGADVHHAPEESGLEIRQLRAGDSTDKGATIRAWLVWARERDAAAAGVSP